MPVEVDPIERFSTFARPEQVVSPPWLSAHLGTPGLKLIEVDEDSFLYNIGHIPGAIRMDWATDLGDPVTRDFIDGERFAELMRSKGISRDDTVVIYGDQHNWWAAYALWVFELFGHPDVRLLDGGRDAWMVEERDTSFAVPEYPRSDYPVVQRNDDDYRVFAPALLSDASDLQIIDVRSPAEYSGIAGGAEAAAPTTLRSGHIPGAVNIQWDTAFLANVRFRSRDELAATYSSLDPDRETVVYCHMGDRSALTWFVLTKILGFSSARNYDGSWSEWGNMVRSPIERDPQP